MHADDVAAYLGPFWRCKEAMAYYEWEKQELERVHAKHRAKAEAEAERHRTA